MILRFIKFGWSISVLAGLGVLLYIYASLPDIVVYSLSDSVFQKAAVSRDTFFYVSLGFLAGINFLFYALSKNMRYKSEAVNNILKQWQLSLALVLNVFFIIVINFIQIVNSGENFDYDYFGYLIYVILAVVLIWILSLPILLIRALRANK